MATPSREVNLGKLYVTAAAKLDTLRSDFRVAEREAADAGRSAGEEFKRGVGAGAAGMGAELAAEMRRAGKQGGDALAGGVERAAAGAGGKLAQAGEKAGAAAGAGVAKGLGKADAQVSAAATEMANQVERAYRARVAQIDWAEFSGQTTTAHADKLRGRARADFNAEMTRGIESLRVRGMLPPEDFEFLVSRFKRVGDAGEDAGDRTAGAFKGALKGVLAAFTVGAVLGWLRSAAALMWRLGTAAEETASKFKTTFGRDGSQAVQAFIDKYGTMMGLSNTAAREMTATTGAIVEGMGAGKKEAARFSIELQKLAGDLQSFHNRPIDEVVASLHSGVTGEYESLKKFGIVLRETDVAQRALTTTGKKHKDSLTQLELAHARLQLVAERMGPALGDLERTQDSNANQARNLAAEWENVQTTASTYVLPVFAAIITSLTQNKDAIKDFVGALGLLVKFLAGSVYNNLASTADVLAGAFTFAVATATLQWWKLREGIAAFVLTYQLAKRAVGQASDADVAAARQALLQAQAEKRNATALAAEGLKMAGRGVSRYFTGEYARRVWGFKPEEGNFTWGSDEPTTTPDTRPARRDAGADRARDQLRQAMEDYRIISSFRDQNGTPFAALESMPQRLRDSVGEMIRLRHQIDELDRQVKASGQAMPPHVRAQITALEQLYTEVEQRARTDAADPSTFLSAKSASAVEDLKRVSEGFAELQRLGVAAGEQIPEGLKDAVAELVRLDAQLSEANKNLDTLRREGVAPPAGAAEYVADLERQRAHVQHLAGSFGELRVILRELPQVTTRLFDGFTNGQTDEAVAQMTRLAEAAGEVHRAESDLATARIQFGENSRQAKDAEKRLTDVRARAATTFAAVAAAVKASNLPLEAQRRLLAAIAAAYQDVGAQAKSAWDGFGQAAGNVATVTRAVGQLGEALGMLSGKTAQALDNFAQMADQAAAFAAAAATGNVAGMIGSGLGFVTSTVNTIKGLFGESAAAKAARSAMLNLERALQSLEKTILNDRSSSELKADRDEVTRAAELLAGNKETFSGYGPTRRGALYHVAHGLGVASAGDDKATAIDKLARWAAELDQKYGLNGLLAGFVQNSDTEGLLKALQGLSQQLGGQIGKLGTWGNDAAGVIARVEWELQALGKTDAALKLKKIREQLAAAGIDLGDFGAQLQELEGLDLSSSTGRKRGEEIIAALVAQANAGGANFGDLTPDQLRDLVQRWADAVRGRADGGTPAGVVEGGDGEGTSTSYQVRNELREVTGTRLVGIMTTGVYWQEATARGVARLVEAVTGTGLVLPPMAAAVTAAGGVASPSSTPAPAPPPGPDAAAGGGVLVLQFPTLPVDVNLTVHGGTVGDLEGAGAAFGRGFGRGFGDTAFSAIDEGLGRRTVERRRAAGRSARAA